LHHSNIFEGHFTSILLRSNTSSKCKQYGLFCITKTNTCNHAFIGHTHMYLLYCCLHKIRIYQKIMSRKRYSITTCKLLSIWSSRCQISLHMLYNVFQMILIITFKLLPIYSSLQLRSLPLIIWPRILYLCVQLNFSQHKM